MTRRRLAHGKVPETPKRPAKWGNTTRLRRFASGKGDASDRQTRGESFRDERARQKLVKASISNHVRPYSRMLGTRLSQGTQGTGRAHQLGHSIPLHWHWQRIIKKDVETLPPWSRSTSAGENEDKREKVLVMTHRARLGRTWPA